MDRREYSRFLPQARSQMTASLSVSHSRATRLCVHVPATLLVKAQHLCVGKDRWAVARTRGRNSAGLRQPPCPQQGQHNSHDLRPSARATRSGAHAGAVLALVVAFSIVAPPAARSQSVPGGVPEIVSVDITGNLHVPTATIMQVIQARPGVPYDRNRAADLERINALGYFASIAPPLVRARPTAWRSPIA